MKTIKLKFRGVKFINTLQDKYTTTFTVIPTFGYLYSMFEFIIVIQFLFFVFKVGFEKV
ncbi:MAG: hypothetical protein L3J35_03550 [Bacteroidales bacterium]|nr:hypothetical protein [Bacteroidales bacterium]